MANHCLIVDGFSLMFRAFYGYPLSISNAKGDPQNAIFGFLTLLFNAIDKFQPSHLVICFDTKEPTFRHQLFDEYKANRSSPPDEFVVQIQPLKTLLSDMGIMVVEKPGFEADDLMGAIAQANASSESQALILTGDKDALQLVSPNISVVITRKGLSELDIYTPNLVLEKCGYSADQVIDYKALKGDSSDNIPGVKGIGDKTAIQLLQQFGSLDNIYSKLDEIKSASVKKKLTEQRELAYVSQKLATIQCDVELEHSFQSYMFNPDWGNVVRLLRDNEFQRLAQRLESKATTQDPTLSVVEEVSSFEGVTESIIKTSDELTQFLKQCHQGFAIDIETTSLNPQEAEIVGIAIATSATNVAYVVCNPYIDENPNVQGTLLFGEPEQTPSSQKECHELLSLLKPFLESPDIPKIAHNWKYEQSVFHHYGIAVQGMSFDTMIAAFLLFPGDGVGLKALTSRHLKVSMTPFEDIVGKGSSAQLLQSIPIETVAEYACMDAVATYRLYELFNPQLDDKNLRRLFDDIEMPLVGVLQEMETHGVHIDRDYLDGLYQEFSSKISQLQSDIFELAGRSFNVKSPQQLGEVLFDELQLPVIRKTKTSRSTDSSVLNALISHHPIAEKLLHYRQYDKLLSTYVGALPQLISPYTGKIHTSYNQTVVVTGRLSSTQPNLQNIPIRSDDGQKIRRAFTASSENHCLLAVDYSQIELRLMAHLAQDQVLIDAFLNGADIHQSTAAMIFGIDQDAVSSEQRYRAKAINFGILYGMSAHGLSENLGVTRSEAQAMIDDYFAKFPSIKEFMDTTIKFVEENGYVATLYGRRRYFPDINNRVFQRRQFAQRAAINTRVQGTAADIMKKAMIQIHQKIHDQSLDTQMIMQVHDELVFNVPNHELSKVEVLVQRLMEDVESLSVPLTVSMNTANYWNH